MTTRTINQINSTTVFSTAAAAAAEARKLADNYNRIENRSGEWEATRQPRRCGNGWSARIEFWEVCPQPQRIKFALRARRIHTDFAIAVCQGNVDDITKALINATRLWNYADHVTDCDQLWHILDTYCGQWFFADRQHTEVGMNSARFTYHNSGPIVRLLNVAGAVTDYVSR